MTDFSKLVHVSDDIAGRKQRTATAPSVKPSTKANPLDSMNLMEKVADSSPSKVLILDDLQILKIMNAPREKKRKLLSRLTDSQRRRVLARYRELTKVQDDDESDAKLDLFTLDSIVNNLVYCPDNYNKGLYDDFKSKHSIPSEIQEFTEAAYNTDQQKVVDLLPAYTEFMKSQGIESDVKLADDLVPEESSEEVTDSVSNMDSINERARADAEAAFDGNFDFADIDQIVSDLVNSGAGTFESVEEAYTDAWNARFGELVRESKGITDSLRVQLSARKIADDILDQIAEKPFLDDQGNEVKPMEERSFLDVFSEALEDFANGDSDLLQQVAATTFGGSTVDAPAEDEAPVDETPEEPADETPEDNEESSGEDVAIDEADEDEDGDPENEEVSDSAGAEQREAANIVEEMDHIVVTNEKQDEERKKGLQELLKTFQSQSHETFEHQKSVLDSINLAKSIVNHTPDVALIDSLKSLVPALQKYNFISDAALPFYTQTECQPGVVDVPLTHDEFYTLNPVVPDYFPNVVASYPCPMCGPVSAYEPQQDYLQVQACGVPQNYYPYDCSMQEITDLLGCTDSADYASVINAHCRPVSHIFHLAALTNNLSILDSRFYKKHLGDSTWYFDEVPACLSGLVQGPGAIKAVKDGAINLYGVTFNLVK